MTKPFHREAQWNFFAAAALQKTANGDTSDQNHAQAASEAAKYADAMMVEMQKREDEYDRIQQEEMNRLRQEEMESEKPTKAKSHNKSGVTMGEPPGSASGGTSLDSK